MVAQWVKNHLQCRRCKRCRKIPGGGHGNPLQYPCLENPTDRGAWWATFSLCLFQSAALPQTAVELGFSHRYFRSMVHDVRWVDSGG